MSITKVRTLYCCGCSGYRMAELITGKEAYPHRADLHTLPFWQCRDCGNFVGCHHKTKDRTRPLGCIPSPEVKAVRQRVHRVLDPLWQSGQHTRSSVYAYLTEVIGRVYHTADIRSVSEGYKVLDALRKFSEQQTQSGEIV